MRKITLILFLGALVIGLQAQIVYPTILMDNLETTNGIPANMNVYKQTIWTTYNATNNPYIYTGTTWKDLYSDNGTAANRTYRVSAYAENRTGGTGTQCLKFDLTGLAFGSYATPFAVRWRSLDNIITFNTAAGETITKYEVTFWARVDGADKACMLNTKSPNTYLTLTSSWQQFTITRYCTGTSSTALGFDFFPLSDNSDYSVYIDDITVKQRLIPYTSAATSINSSGFTANWATVTGATSYNLTVEKYDGVSAYTAISGSPFVINDGATSNYNLAGLDPNTTYRYSVTATDGTLTTLISNVTSVTTSPLTGFGNVIIKSVYVENNKIVVNAQEGNLITVYNAAGQKMYSGLSKEGLNEITVNSKGIYVVKTGNETHKVIL